MNPRNEAELARWRGRTVVSRGAEKIGTIEEIYVDERTGRPEWMAVKTGLLGGKVSFVPVAGAESSGAGVRVPYDRADIKHAPSTEPDGVLSFEEESALYRYYGFEDADPAPAAPAPAAQDAPPPAEAPTPPPGDAMTRSEEELRVGTRSREAGRVRLRKHVVTENVTTTVPVRREEMRLEREPITEGDAVAPGAEPAISEAEQEVVLHEEEVVVEKRVVPKERVRLGKEVVTDEQTVSDEVRKERIDADGTDAP
jgi:uncharacterized protein (TIGR02271 family)